MKAEATGEERKFAAPGRKNGVVSADLRELEAQAQAFLSPMAFDYIRGGAGDEISREGNRAAYDRLRLNPRILTDVTQLDLSVKLLGATLAHPILLAPAAFHRLFHPEGELDTARGADATGAAMVVSSFATTAIEEIVAINRNPVWMQLYINPDRGLARTLVERAERAGCRAMCLTVDTPVLGRWYGKEKLIIPADLPIPNVARPKWAEVATRSAVHSGIYAPELDASLSWKDLKWLRSITSRPLVLKGVVNPEDAARAVDEGVDAIIVSNHGGRNLDTLPPTIEALPRVAERVVGRVPLLVDGGIRRGTDVLKALALGATAILIGRPYLYGLAIAGAVGVSAVVETLRGELQMAMALCGRKSLAEIDAAVLWQ